ncbi:outer membrane beta-barrel protein [Flaviaesturariibacter amylovorans]|uniref:Outer membrane protein beta-barrel domain-containing protein n=1 Tax=Flaviaesturariibacter amylovorans TaxID=1084520 RepID=A0ABP8GA78_9BACT
MRIPLSLLAALLLAHAAHAQTTDPEQQGDRKAAAAGHSPSFSVKWNPGSLAFGKVSLHGEYNLKRKKSVTFGIGIPVSNTFDRTISGDDVRLENKTLSVMAGYRMYLGKKTMTGVYFEPYLKYLDYKGTGLYTYNGGFVPEVYQASVNHSGAGLGAQLGVQFMIAKLITFDLFLLGPEANFGKSDAVFRQVSGSPVAWDGDDVAESLRDLPIIGNDLEITIDNSNRTVTARRKGFTPGFRAGLSVGVRF